MMNLQKGANNYEEVGAIFDSNLQTFAAPSLLSVSLSPLFCHSNR